MDLRVAIGCVVAFLIVVSLDQTEGRSKKVVIHVPYKVKKIKHIHTVYKTLHHHHKHRDPLSLEQHHIAAGTDDHEHFHHMHLHDDSSLGQHSQPVVGIGIPEFLPDVPMDVPDIPDLAHDMPGLLGQRHVPYFRRSESQEEEDSEE